MRRARAVVLSNGVVGAEKQAAALASAVGLPVSTRAAALLPGRVDALPTPLLLGGARAGALTRWLPSWRPPFPALAISCGRGSIPASVALRDASGGQTLTVHVQRPDCDEGRFDLVVACARSQDARSRAL
jgi:mitochondrial fission protein ELM1